MKYFKICIFLLFFPYIAHATTGPPCVCRSFALPELIQKVKSAAATIYVFNTRGEVVNQGSGFFITENVVISSRHVFWKEAASHGKVVVVSPRAKNTTEYPIKHIIGDNVNSDLVMLAVENPPTTGALQPHVNISLGEVKEGEDVFVISSPEDLRGSIGTGIISAIHNDYDIQISVSAISAGSSGAPIFNYDGEVIGVVVGQFQSGQNLNFGISVQGIVDLVKDIEERQKERLLAASKHPSKTQPLLPPPEKKPPMSRRHHWTFAEAQSEVNSEECTPYPTIKEWINTQEEFKQKKKTNSFWGNFKRLWRQVTNSSQQEAES